jgi:hypothetical protein
MYLDLAGMGSRELRGCLHLRALVWLFAGVSTKQTSEGVAGEAETRAPPGLSQLSVMNSGSIFLL